MAKSKIASKPAFFAHNLENKRDKRMVTRSSAVFYFVQTEIISTEIHFMNYWKLKRGSKVLLNVSLRHMDGKRFHTQSIEIDRQGGYVIKVSDLLNCPQSDKSTHGSIEIEFLSSTDIAIAYPAAVVRYVGQNWHTVAHSSQRYFSEVSGDDEDIINTISEIEEGNLTIHSEKNIEPFLIIHNGPLDVDSHIPILTIWSEDGQKTVLELEAWSWHPFQTRFIKLSELCDFRSILGNKAGTYSIKTLLGGVFPRLIAGNCLNDQLSVDHTNFAAVHGPASSDKFPSANNHGFKELVFNLPNNLIDNWRCFVDLYPTYPDSNYVVRKSLLDRRGNSLHEDIIYVAKNDERRLVRIEMNNETARDLNMELSFHHEKWLPRRFHMGIHYQANGGLPGFLTDGPLPCTTPPIKTRWFPVFQVSSCKNYLLIASRFVADEEPQSITYRAQLFNCFGNDPISVDCTLNEFESKCILIDGMFPNLKDYLRGGSGWVYLTSNLPQRSVFHYASLNGETSLAVCHAF